MSAAVLSLAFLKTSTRVDKTCSGVKKTFVISVPPQNCKSVFLTFFNEHCDLSKQVLFDLPYFPTLCTPPLFGSQRPWGILVHCGIWFPAQDCCCPLCSSCPPGCHSPCPSVSLGLDCWDEVTTCSPLLMPVHLHVAMP